MIPAGRGESGSASGGPSARDGRATFEPLDGFVVLCSTVEPTEFPSSVWAIARSPRVHRAEPPACDPRGVHRRYPSMIDGDRWIVELDDPAWRESPRFRQGHVGDLAADSSRVSGAWQRAEGEW